METFKKICFCLLLVITISLKLKAQNYKSDFFGYSIIVQHPLHVIENKYHTLYIRLKGAQPRRDIYDNLIVSDIITITPLPSVDLNGLQQSYQNLGLLTTLSGNVLYVRTQIMDMALLWIFLLQGKGMAFLPA